VSMCVLLTHSMVRTRAAVGRRCTHRTSAPQSRAVDESRAPQRVLVSAGTRSAWSGRRCVGQEGVMYGTCATLCRLRWVFLPPKPRCVVCGVWTEGSAGGVERRLVLQHGVRAYDVRGDAGAGLPRVRVRRASGGSQRVPDLHRQPGWLYPPVRSSPSPPCSVCELVTRSSSLSGWAGGGDAGAWVGRVSRAPSRRPWGC
jgi:hypothetical protein